MPKMIFLDLETTGLEDRDKICEIGLISEDEKGASSFGGLCHSDKKISNEAMAIHHITNEMIKGMPACKDNEAYWQLEAHNQFDNVLIAHNIRFDLAMLEKEGFEVKMQTIDTLRCVKALIPECETFNLQFLRYELGLYKEEKKEAEHLKIDLQAHRALSDALHVKLLCQTLFEYAPLEQLIEISSKPVLLEKLSFGKYKGRFIEDIANTDPNYLLWLKDNLHQQDEDLVYSIGQMLSL